MHLVSRALVRVRTVLFGPPPESGRAAHEPDTAPGTAPAGAPRLPADHPSPEMWAAFLASARRRRARGPWPRAELPDITPDDIASTLVGAYVLTCEVRQQRRQARQFAEVS
ncbi:hypothetical protein [Streptomyces adelaidensis]|uniref:hypothetical protein n=1 Tax=Streptomyces adelaidensis TaxID=2796465 RepID=UPI001F42F901|nr:hypothetical protein [Streptomyces adelaidensis]